MSAGDDSLRELFSHDDFSWLIKRLVGRMQRGQPLVEGSATLRDPNANQRRAIDDLMGRRSTRGKSMSVDLSDLAVRLGCNDDQLRQLVIDLRGPVENLSARREAESQAWGELFCRWQSTFRARPEGEEWLAWLEDLQRSGQLKKAGGGSPQSAAVLLEQTASIFDAAPHDDILLASLAASVTGDSHALDRGRALAHLCLRAIFHLFEIDSTGDAESRREAWSEIGVVVDDLSAPALCLNLHPAPECESAEWIDWHRLRGEPLFLSWRQVGKFLPDPQRSGPVHVCENPAIVSEAARRLGPRSRPLICLNGVPSGAVRKLLLKLLDAGRELKMRTDFDWAGLRILDRWISRERVSTWRMTTKDYQACSPAKPLRGVPCEPDWATDLAAAMKHSGLAAFEESLVDRLIDDLNEG